MRKPIKITGADVLFENENILAVNKIPNVLVIPDQHTPIGDTLLGAAQDYVKNKLWILHRIDRGTSGVVLFAKNVAAHSHISQQFEKGKVKKTYLALLRGNLAEDEGVIDAAISIEGRNVALDKDGKPSVTGYKVIEKFRDFTLVEAYPGTGRRHQIRLHFLSLGCPLVVDGEYASTSALFLSEFKKRYKTAGLEKPLLGRLSLHAKRITLTEPSLNTPLTIESPMPKDFEITIKQLRKYNKAGW